MLAVVEGVVLVVVTIVLLVVTLVLDATEFVTTGSVIDDGVIGVEEVVEVTIVVVDFLVAVDMVFLGELDVSISNRPFIPVVPMVDKVEVV